MQANREAEEADRASPDRRGRIAPVKALMASANLLTTRSPPSPRRKKARFSAARKRKRRGKLYQLTYYNGSKE